MSQIKISELPSGVAENDAVVPATNAAGNQTNKIKLTDIVNLSHNHDTQYYTETEIDSLLSNLPVPVNASVAWTSNHTIADGTRYLAGDVVYSGGNIYRAKFDNESQPVSDTTYWENLGPGHRINIDGRDIPNIPYPVTSVNGLTGSVTVDVVDTGDVVFNGSTISTSDENTSLLINCGQGDTLGPPEAGGSNDRIRLWDFEGTGSNFNYAIGAEGNHMWFSMDVNDGTGGFKFYSRDNEIFKISDDSKLIFPNATTIAQGTFDNNTGGSNGISLNCAVGYELNWQGGRLKSTYDNGLTASPIYVDSPMSVTPVTVETAYGSTITVDAKYGDMFDVTLTGNATLDNPLNPVNGKTLRWRISQDSTGGRTVTLGNKFNIPSSATSPLPWSTAPNKMDILAATYHAGRDKWDVVAFVPGY